jgi:glycosyltransferase involved in cell wall biosynthesis
MRNSTFIEYFKHIIKLEIQVKKTIFHIIPKLTNGGAETVLARLVEEFSKKNVEQVVISIQGDENEFNYSKIAQFSKVIHVKEDFSPVKEVFQNYPEAIVLAWMYKGVLKAHQWKSKFNTQQKIFWNIRQSSFRWNQLYQKTALFVFGIYSHLKQPKIIYCSYRSKEVHELYFFSKKKRTVIQNRLAKERVPSRSEDKESKEGKEPYFLYVGRYDPIKGPRRLVQLAEVFFSKNSGINLKIAGSGWTIDKIPQQIRDRVFLLGNVKNIFSLYREAQALLFTSHAEGYPNVLVEAVISGTPIVGFEAGDSKLILDNYKFGHSIKTRKEFMNKLRYVIDNPVDEEEKTKEIAYQQKQLDFSITVQEYWNFLEMNSAKSS